MCASSNRASLESRAIDSAPGGKERMRRLMAVIAARRVDSGAMVTHRFKLDDVEAAYELFGHQRDGVLKVAITP